LRAILSLSIILALYQLLGTAVKATAETINVAAAISLKDALGDAAKAYEANSGIHIELTLGASGRLANQILQGSPTDLFISADAKHVSELAEAHLVKDGRARVVARNSLVLIVPADASSPPAGFAQLADPSVKRIAIGEPKTVPAGEYAMQVFASLKLQGAVAPRLVYGSNVRQVLTYVETGEVSAGIVYATDAIEAGSKVKVVATADAATHRPIAYYAAPIVNSKENAAADKFLEYLLGPAGQTALIAHGFVPAEPPATNPAKASP
jgi:molybdate transport system substrate-binding protein